MDSLHHSNIRPIFSITLYLLVAIGLGLTGCRRSFERQYQHRYSENFYSDSVQKFLIIDTLTLRDKGFPQTSLDAIQSIPYTRHFDSTMFRNKIVKEHLTQTRWSDNQYDFFSYEHDEFGLLYFVKTNNGLEEYILLKHKVLSQEKLRKELYKCFELFNKYGLHKVNQVEQPN